MSPKKGLYSLNVETHTIQSHRHLKPAGRTLELTSLQGVYIETIKVARHMLAFWNSEYQRVWSLIANCAKAGNYKWVAESVVMPMEGKCIGVTSSGGSCGGILLALIYHRPSNLFREVRPELHFETV
jgi:hypothetical protein